MSRYIKNRREAMELLESPRATYFLPTVTEVTHRGEREWHLFSRLLKDRIVFITSEISDDVANAVIAQFLFLESEDPEKDIHVYVNTPGGVVTSGLAIFDTMQLVRSPISTTCIGQAASMGAILLAAGERGSRFALPHSRIMIHQPLGGARGQASDIEIQAREIKKMKETLIDILVDATGQSRDRIGQDIERDFYLSSGAAKEYGLIDEVLTRREDPPKKKD